MEKVRISAILFRSVLFESQSNKFYVDPNDITTGEVQDLFPLVELSRGKSPVRTKDPDNRIQSIGALIQLPSYLSELLLGAMVDGRICESC